MIRLLQTGGLHNLLKEVLCLSEGTFFGINDLTGPVFLESNNHEVWSSNLSQELMDREVLVRKKREGNAMFFPERIDLENRISCANANHLDSIFEIGNLLYHLIEGVDLRSRGLTLRAVKAEDFHDDNVCLDLRDFEKMFP
jgi:hypothetical protein